LSPPVIPFKIVETYFSMMPRTTPGVKSLLVVFSAGSWYGEKDHPAVRREQKAAILGARG
jgi:hypothetical protein